MTLLLQRCCEYKAFRCGVVSVDVVSKRTTTIVVWLLCNGDAGDWGEEFSLKWNDHSKVFFAGAEDLAEKQEFTDVTLAAGGKLITAHKMVLSICSPFFQRLFKQLGTVGPEKTVVYLKDVQPRHLDLLIQYMYRGEIKVEVRQPSVHC